MKNVFTTYNEETTYFVQSTILQKLDELISMEKEIYACDLHNEIFNTDYLFIYYSDAIAFCDGFGTFDAIEKVVSYEQDTFGQSTTDISDPCKVANMLCYIVGEEVMNECNVLRGFWDEKIGVDELTEIRDEFKAQFNIEL